MDIRIERTLSASGFTKKHLNECNPGDIVAFESSYPDGDGDYCNASGDYSPDDIYDAKLVLTANGTVVN